MFHDHEAIRLDAAHKGSPINRMQPGIRINLGELMLGGQSGTSFAGRPMATGVSRIRPLLIGASQGGRRDFAHLRERLWLMPPANPPF
ncbi:hypothetical protein EI42_05624 [Thermosporothrix hazakensis]|jgi:hypothetical protein|uniref:Uncharacterized protein n=1 Tax=Thermosporothrix hazakensis TaxID=644383 RepID=A0A326U5M2_THEHA|nr:hypothetical protein [Thermosporothrix hazakensis]PZW21088.1 hypothetical protein EI42_05624 [Thermosporothrix hazakensis]GCE50746.1 hypothetical protein KTH_56150 [Thermosporothrix hazakensis]